MMMSQAIAELKSLGSTLLMFDSSEFLSCVPCNPLCWVGTWSTDHTQGLGRPSQSQGTPSYSEQVARAHQPAQSMKGQ